MKNKKKIEETNEEKTAGAEFIDRLLLIDFNVRSE